jgi:hypothetical protein
MMAKLIYDVLVKAELEYNANDVPTMAELEKELHSVITAWVAQKGGVTDKIGTRAIPNLVSLDVKVG